MAAKKKPRYKRAEHLGDSLLASPGVLLYARAVCEKRAAIFCYSFSF